jgi:hypothetical protein
VASVAPLRRNGKVQPGRAAADAHDSHITAPIFVPITLARSCVTRIEVLAGSGRGGDPHPLRLTWVKATAHDDRATTYLSAPPATPAAVTPATPAAAVTPATPAAAVTPALLPVNPLIVILDTPLITIPAKSEDFRDLHVRPYLSR